MNCKSLITAFRYYGLEGFSGQCSGHLLSCDELLASSTWPLIVSIQTMPSVTEGKQFLGGVRRPRLPRLSSNLECHSWKHRKQIDYCNSIFLKEPVHALSCAIQLTTCPVIWKGEHNTREDTWLGPNLVTASARPCSTANCRWWECSCCSSLYPVTKFDHFVKVIPRKFKNTHFQFLLWPWWPWSPNSPIRYHRRRGPKSDN